MPKWMATIDKTTPAAALGLAAVLSGAIGARFGTRPGR